MNIILGVRIEVRIEVRLTEDALYVTINPHKGLFQYDHLPFEVNSARDGDMYY